MNHNPQQQRRGEPGGHRQPGGRPGGGGGNDRDEANRRRVDEIKSRIEALTRLAAYPARQLVDDAKTLASVSRDKDLKTAQIRKIYGTVKDLELTMRTKGFQYDKIVFLLPKLAYAANKKREVDNLRDVLSACIERIQDDGHGQQDFERFVNFFEAVLAYHRG